MFKKIIYYFNMLMENIMPSYVDPGSGLAITSEHHNIKAMLLTIRWCEGTASKDGYRKLFGGKLFGSFADHPRFIVRLSGYSSSAAGAYQILQKTYDAVKGKAKVNNFTPLSQDKLAIQLIKNRGVYNLIKQGNIKDALENLSKEWASIPCPSKGWKSYYNQPVRSKTELYNKFRSYGGIVLQ